jgi:hypothetical protein
MTKTVTFKDRTATIIKRTSSKIELAAVIAVAIAVTLKEIGDFG